MLVCLCLCLYLFHFLLSFKINQKEKKKSYLFLLVSFFFFISIIVSSFSLSWFVCCVCTLCLSFSSFFQDPWLSIFLFVRVCVRVCIFLFLLSFQIHDSLFLSLSARVFYLYLSFQILNFLDLWCCVYVQISAIGECGHGYLAMGFGHRIRSWDRKSIHRWLLAMGLWGWKVYRPWVYGKMGFRPRSMDKMGF